MSRDNNSNSEEARLLLVYFPLQQQAASFFSLSLCQANSGKCLQSVLLKPAGLMETPQVQTDHSEEESLFRSTWKGPGTTSQALLWHQATFFSLVNCELPATLLNFVLLSNSAHTGTAGSYPGPRWSYRNHVQF